MEVSSNTVHTPIIDAIRAHTPFTLAPFWTVQEAEIQLSCTTDCSLCQGGMHRYCKAAVWVAAAFVARLYKPLQRQHAQLSRFRP